MPLMSSLLLIVAEGVVDDGRADGLALRLDSYEEEVHQVSATESYLDGVGVVPGDQRVAVAQGLSESF